MKAEGKFAIEALQNTNLDPDIYLLSESLDNNLNISFMNLFP
jgi:hypothetical protein